MAEAGEQIKPPEVKITPVPKDSKLSPTPIETQVDREIKPGPLNIEKTGKNTFENLLQTKPLNEQKDPNGKENINVILEKLRAYKILQNLGEFTGMNKAVEMTRSINDQIKDLTDLFDYTEVQSDIDKGKPLDDVLMDKKIVDVNGEADKDKWKKTRERVLDGVLQHKKITEIFPFLREFDIDENRRIIEKIIVMDPALQTKVVDKMDELQNRINKLPEVKDDSGEEKKDERSRLEGKIVTEFGNVLPSAIFDVLWERYRQREKVAREQRRRETDVDMKKLTQKMDKNWISDEGEINTKKIGEDIRFVVYNGSIGVDRLLMRDLDLKLKDDQGNPLKDENGADAKWENVDKFQLSAGDRALLDKAKARYGDQYQKKLLSDFAAARITEKFRSGKFGVNDDLELKQSEWGLLNQNFGDELEKDVNKIPRGENIIQLLKDKGLDKREDKAGWTIALLYNLGIGFVGNAEEATSAEFSDKLS